jgi:hypothetical protein
VVFLDPCKADVQFGQLPPPRHLEYDVTSMGDDLGAAARDWVSERTDYPRHVAQLALAHEADGGVVNVDFDWRPKNNVSNYASAEGTAMSDKSFERHRQGRRRRGVLRAQSQLPKGGCPKQYGLSIFVVHCKTATPDRASKHQTNSHEPSSDEPD